MSNEDLLRRIVGRSSPLARGEFRIHNPNTSDLEELERQGHLTVRTSTLGTTDKDDGKITSTAYSLSGKGIVTLGSDFDRLEVARQADDDYTGNFL